MAEALAALGVSPSEEPGIKYKKINIMSIFFLETLISSSLPYLLYNNNNLSYLLTQVIIIIF